MNETTYRMIGADGREYGPSTPDQMRQWIREGRANARTQVSQDLGDWKPLGDRAEFAELLAARQAEANPPPKINRIEAEKLASDVIARGRPLVIGDCLSRGWAIYTRHFWPSVGATTLVLLIQSGLWALSSSFAWLPYLLLLGPLTGGLAWFFLKLVRGQPAMVSDVFAGFSMSFVQLMLAGLVSSVLVAVGFAFCLVPGIYLTVAWVFGLLLVLDKGMEFWPALELSRRVVTSHWWPMFGLLFIGALLSLLGTMVLVVGFFFTTPLVVAAVVWAYEELFREVAAPEAAPPLKSPPAAPMTPSTAEAPAPVAPPAAPDASVPVPTSPTPDAEPSAAAVTTASGPPTATDPVTAAPPASDHPPAGGS